MTEKLDLRPPSFLKRAAETVGIREVIPPDICPDNKVLGSLFETYPDLAGDPNFGEGNDGACQSWRGDRGWWKSLVEKQKVLK